MSTDPYQAALDEIYRSLMRVKHLVKGRLDRDTRQPRRILDIAAKLDLLPPPERLIKVTGSKGKGTTARAAARLLQAQVRPRRVGLFVSPEEIEHTDRMRIDGAPISRNRFVEIHDRLRPHLQHAERSLTAGQYISPLGTFLLMTLAWFREEGVSYAVLETGRGVRHDEVGQIPARVGVVTSLLVEHADKLGPSLRDIAADKLSIRETSGIVILSDSAAVVAADLGIELPRGARIAPALPSDGVSPSWLASDVAMARLAVAQLLPQRAERSHGVGNPELADVSAAFATGTFAAVPFAIEAAINLDSLDRPLIDAWRRHHGRLHAVLSLPDDKDRARIVEFFIARGIPMHEVVLDGTRGYLDYAKAIEDGRTSKVALHYDDVAGCRHMLEELVACERPDFLYVLGTQTFVRLAKRAIMPAQAALQTQAENP